MNELVGPYPNKPLFKVTMVSFGVFVTGCVYKQPEIALPALATGGMGILKLVSDFTDFIDMRNDLIAEAVQVVTDAAEYS